MREECVEALARQLERKHPDAAASLREGLDETLTVLRFELPEGLMRPLATTNPIEFLNSRIRKTTHNVTRWETGEMVLRWLAQATHEASKTFRKLRGHKSMPSSSRPSVLTMNASTPRPLTTPKEPRNPPMPLPEIPQRTGRGLAAARAKGSQE